MVGACRFDISGLLSGHPRLVRTMYQSSLSSSKAIRIPGFGGLAKVGSLCDRPIPIQCVCEIDESMPRVFSNLGELHSHTWKQ